MRNNRLQTIMSKTAENCNLAVTYLLVALKYQQPDVAIEDLEPAVAAMFVAASRDEQVMNDEGFAIKPELLIERYVNQKVDIEEIDIKDIKDLPSDKYSIVNFEYGGGWFWVAYKGHELLYKSVDFSPSFSYGKPTRAIVMNFTN